MELRIEPDADAQARAALERALARGQARAVTPGRSAWWRVGVRENVADAAGKRSLHPAAR